MSARAPIAWGMVLVIALASSVAHAGTPVVEDPDTEIARRYFEEGKAFYAASDYAQALTRFKSARRVLPRPELDYNIARCHDRLDQPALAIEAYERFLSSPQGHDNAEVRARVSVLRARVEPGSVPVAPPIAPTVAPTIAPTAGTPPPRRPRPYLASGLVLGAALVLGVAGTVLWTDVGPKYDTLDADLLTHGSTQTVRDRARALHAQENTGYVLWGLAGATAVVDVVLWVLAAKRVRAIERAKISASAGGLSWAF